MILKLHPECIPCLLENAGKQAKLATDDERVQLGAISEFIRFLAESISGGVVPALLGAERNRIIMRVTKNSDPYLRHKRLSNDVAVKLRPYVEHLVKKGRNTEEKLRRAIVASVIGNSMEFGVAGYGFKPSTFRQEFERLFTSGLDYDDLDRVIPRILDSREILYLTDNSGEIILDRVLMCQIEETGVNLFVTAKSSPVQEDVTLDEARELGIDELGELLSSGTSVGVDPSKAPKGLRKKLKSADLILSKGMGNYETLSEFEGRLKGRLVYLLRAKCQPVASSLGVKKGALVAKFLA